MVRTRFAPSPTGFLHVGGARTALYSYLIARQNKGEFILRIEDTDLQRSNAESVQAILDGMEWLKLDYDEGPIFQTKRFERYREAAMSLLETGQAYYCDCSKERLDALRETQMANQQKPRYDGHCRARQDVNPRKPHVIRFKNPTEGSVSWQDLVKGEISFANAELDDLVIIRSDGSPTYNFTVVVDDFDMNITYVIRGDDHVNNTPRQINILKAMGKILPFYAHVPMILGEDGKRLSKRHGAESVMQYDEEGYLPAALLNYLFRLGFAFGDQEVFTLSQMIDCFKLEKVSRSPAIFNLAKLNWLNQHYMKTLPFENILPALKMQFAKLGLSSENGPDLHAVYSLLCEREHTLKGIAEKAGYFYTEDYARDQAAMDKHLNEETQRALARLAQKFKNLPNFKSALIQEAMQEVAAELNLPMGKIGMPLRVVLTGGTQSPSIDITAELIGKERSLLRLKSCGIQYED